MTQSGETGEKSTRLSLKKTLGVLRKFLHNAGDQPGGSRGKLQKLVLLVQTFEAALSSPKLAQLFTKGKKSTCFYSRKYSLQLKLHPSQLSNVKRAIYWRLLEDQLFTFSQDCSRFCIGFAKVKLQEKCASMIANDPSCALVVKVQFCELSFCAKDQLLVAGAIRTVTENYVECAIMAAIPVHILRERFSTTQKIVETENGDFEFIENSTSPPTVLEVGKRIKFLISHSPRDKAYVQKTQAFVGAFERD